MNRQERRKLKKQGIQVPKDPSINIKLSDLGRDIMTPDHGERNDARNQSTMPGGRQALFP